MTEELKLELMKKFRELNIAEYTTKYGDYYGLMFAGAEIATKELQEEIQACKFAMAMSEKVEKQLREENAELNKQLEMSNKVYNDNLDYSHHIEEQLTKAKVALRNVIDYLGQFCSDYPDCVIEAEQFIKKDSEVEK